MYQPNINTTQKGISALNIRYATLVVPRVIEPPFKV